MNKGPDVLAKDRIRWAWLGVILFSIRSWDVSLGPIGYPEVMLITKIYAAIPGHRNNGLTIGSIRMPRKSTTPKWIRREDPMKKGNRDGTTIVNQRFKPFLAAS